MGKRPIPKFAIAFLILFLAQMICAQVAVAQAQGGSSDINTRLAQLEQQAADAKSSADNAWMLTSAALVLMMTGPGLALFYGGLVRKKNVLGTAMQSFALMAVITVLWGLCQFQSGVWLGKQLYWRTAQSVSARRGGSAGRRLCRDHSVCRRSWSTS